MLFSISQKSAAWNDINAQSIIVIILHTLQLVHGRRLEGAQQFWVNESMNAVCPCVDVPPLGGLTCQEQKGQNKCGEWWMLWGDFCSITCGRCSCQPHYLQSQPTACTCIDVQPPGSGNCEQQKKWGKCDADWMLKKSDDAVNGYCQKTCGRCDCEDSLPSKHTSLDENGESCSCSDATPANSELSCKEQKEMGKCEADWMFDTTITEGYCQTTCGRCSCSDEQMQQVQIKPCLPFKEFLNRTEGLSLYASLFDNEIIDSFMEQNLNQSVTILVPRDEGFQNFLEEYGLDIQQLVNDPFLTLQSIIQPSVLSMGAYLSTDFLPKQLLLTQSGFTVQIDEMSGVGWYFSDDLHTSLVVQPDINLCEATVQIVSHPIIPFEALQPLLSPTSKKQYNNDTSSFSFEATPTYSQPPFVQKLVAPRTCVPFVDFLEIIDGVGMYAELCKDPVVQSVIETSLQEPVTILVPLDEGLQAFMKERNLTMEQLKKDSFKVIKQIITPSIIVSGAHKIDSFREQQQFMIYSGFNLSVDQLQDGKGSWYFQGEQEDLALISQPDIPLCNAIVHVITKPLLPKHTLSSEHQNVSSPQQDKQSVSQMIDSLASLSLTHRNHSDEKIIQAQTNKNQTRTNSSSSSQVLHPVSTSDASVDQISSQVSPQHEFSVDDQTRIQQHNVSVSPSPSSKTQNYYSDPADLQQQEEELQSLQQSPVVPRCRPFQSFLDGVDDVSLFGQLFADEFLSSYMKSTLQQRMTVLVPSDDGFQRFLDENDLTLEFLMEDPFLVLVSIVQPNIVIMGAFETQDFIEQQSLLTQSGESLTVNRESASSSNWYFERNGQKALIVDSDIPTCNAIIQVINDPLIQPQMLEENAQISGSQLYPSQNTNNTSHQQIVNVTMSIQVLDKNTVLPK